MSQRYPTLVDLTKALDPDGGISAVAEILHETNEMLADIPFFEGNLPTGHRSSIRAGIPEPTFRAFYQGVQPTKSQRVQVTDTTAMMEAYAVVDKALADLNGNSAKFRLQEDAAHIEGMSQAAQQAFIYGNAALNPTQFNGLAPRFNSRNAAFENSQNVIHGGGDDNANASIWLVVWGPQTCHGIYPKASKAGLSVTDHGEVTVQNFPGEAAGAQFQAYQTHYRWDLGLVVRDWRYIVRIANIKRATLNADPAVGGANLPNLMFEALERLPSMSMGQPVFYMDRFTRTRFRQQLASSVRNGTLEWANVGGIRTQMWNEVPLRRVDKLAVNEALVAA